MAHLKEKSLVSMVNCPMIGRVIRRSVLSKVDGSKFRFARVFIAQLLTLENVYRVCSTLERRIVNTHHYLI